YAYVGAIAGVPSFVIGSSSSGSVSATNSGAAKIFVGGVAGQADIYWSRSTANVSGLGQTIAAGGIVGIGHVYDSSAGGDVSADVPNGEAGGLVGEGPYGGAIDDSFATGTIKGY